MPSNKEKIRMYESLLHQIQLCHVAVDIDTLKQLLSNICDWSYAHRAGDGRLSEEEQQGMVDKAFHSLCEVNKDE